MFCAVYATLLTLAVGSVLPLEEAYYWDHGTVREDSVPGTEGTAHHVRCVLLPSCVALPPSAYSDPG